MDENFLVYIHQVGHCKSRKEYGWKEDCDVFKNQRNFGWHVVKPYHLSINSDTCKYYYRNVNEELKSLDNLVQEHSVYKYAYNAKNGFP